MISAQNHQPRLNGSRFLYFLMFTLLMAASCDSLKKVQGTSNSGNVDKEKTELEEIQGKKVVNPKTGQYEDATDVSGKMDTIAWTETSTTERPPITSDGGNVPIDGDTRTGGTNNDPGVKMNTYDVAVLLPFLGNKFPEFENTMNEKSALALNY